MNGTLCRDSQSGIHDFGCRCIKRLCLLPVFIMTSHLVFFEVNYAVWEKWNLALDVSGTSASAFIFVIEIGGTDAARACKHWNNQKVPAGCISAWNRQDFPKKEKNMRTKLESHGAIYEKSNPFHVHVVEDQRVITGQNPMSATSVGLAIAEALKGVKW